MDAARTLKNNRGIALVYIAILLVALIAMAGLVIDLGYMFVTKSQLQNAADAGALAGASKLNGMFSNYSAHFYAQKFATELGNKAAGEQVKVDLNFPGNYSDGDTVVGCWNGSFHETSVAGCAEANAVKVVARRTTESGSGISPENKPVGIFLGRVMGEKWQTMSAKAVAIAVNSKGSVLPIAVNEYWMASEKSPGQAPYGNNQDYPNSFVRIKNVDGNNSKVFGKTFALMGTRAGNNRVGVGGQSVVDNVNGYVNLDYRNSNNDHSSAGTWYQADNTSICPSCAFAPVTISQGDINSQKFGNSLKYLFEGYPDEYLPPIPVQENLVSPASQYPTTLVSPTPSSSLCPYSTVAYFSSGGTGLPNASTDSPIKKSYSGKSFTQQYPPGKKLIALVYDGIPNPSAVNSVNIVGYSLIEVDGYSNKKPKQLIDNDGNVDKGFFDSDPNVVSTMYGHAVSDMYSGNPVSCSGFLSDLGKLRYQAGTVKLVK